MTNDGRTGLLRDKVAVITGGASGIGQACAIRFAEEGANIVIADIQDGQETVKLVGKAGGRAVFVRTDTTSDADCEAMVVAGVAVFGHVDIGVAAAGVSGTNPADEQVAEVESNFVTNLIVDNFKRVLEINLIGVMLADKALGRQMLAQGTGGSIINIASTAARIPLPGASAYCVSKAGVHMLTKVMALELATTGIRVNAVGPGFTTTPMWHPNQDSLAHRYAMSLTPMGRNGTAYEQADACLFLAGSQSAYMTGQMLHPAGGQFTG